MHLSFPPYVPHVLIITTKFKNPLLLQTLLNIKTFEVNCGGNFVCKEEEIN
jgi:hypothetical protein